MFSITYRVASVANSTTKHNRAALSHAKLQNSGVLAQKFSKGPEELSRTAVFLSELAELVVARKKLAVLDDEPDKRILECAATGHADVIVTGDRAMLNLKKYQEIRILSLRQFLDEISIPDS
jgi:predicted nucleic acid-binding protein